jgi:protein TonB
MTAQRAIPDPGSIDSANERFKGRFRSIFWSGIIVASIAHFAAFTLWPDLTVEDFSFTAGELTAIELPPEVEIPPPPQSIARPATPVIATTAIDQEVTIAPTTFESNPVRELPPPPETEKPVELEAAPTFTPFTVAPEILNRTQLQMAMGNAYPPLLKEAGIGGRVSVFFFIDAEGVVKQTVIDKSSGHAALDEAALSVAGLYRFSPALNRDQRVPVWVSFPIIFRVH